eukprot:1160646-Pelagomonas_calceolata.AAC.5
MGSNGQKVTWAAMAKVPHAPRHERLRSARQHEHEHFRSEEGMVARSLLLVTMSMSALEALVSMSMSTSEARGADCSPFCLQA